MFDELIKRNRVGREKYHTTHMISQKHKHPDSVLSTYQTLLSINKKQTDR